MKPTSLRAYAKHRGVSLNAVQTAIDSHRLNASVVTDERGHRKIADVALADREWHSNTAPRLGHPSTRPPQPQQPHWPAWVPEDVRDFAPTRDELLASYIHHDAFVDALVALHLEDADPVASLDAFLARLQPHLAATHAPGLPFDEQARLALAMAMDEDDEQDATP